MIDDDYMTYALWLWIERETDFEFDSRLWRDDPDMDVMARAYRDRELYLDFIGNIDSKI